MDYGILPRQKFCIKWSGGTRDTVGAGPNQGTEGRSRERRWKREIAAVECIIPWLIEWAAHVLNRFEVRKDGRTAYERCKGKKAKHLGIEFGEAVLWRR